MALNQFKHNHPEPLQVDDITLRGTNSNVNAATLTATNFSAENAVITSPLLFPNVLTGNTTIPANYNGLLPGPINIQGSITINGILVVV